MTAIVFDIVAILMLIAAAYIKGRRDQRVRDSREQDRVDSHPARLRRQIERGAIRVAATGDQTVVIVPRPPQKGPAHD